jgi:hypothetical protein
MRVELGVRVVGTTLDPPGGEGGLGALLREGHRDVRPHRLLSPGPGGPGDHRCHGSEAHAKPTAWEESITK